MYVNTEACTCIYIYMYIYMLLLIRVTAAWRLLTSLNIYRISVLKTSGDALLTHLGTLWTPWGRSEHLMNFCVNMCSNS